ncbi:MAG: hypothetical protein WAN60_11940 [Candidatus Sulfotelmatobacter sp.]
MPIAAFLLSFTWGMLTVFFLLLVRAGAKPVPTPGPRSTQLRTLFVFRVQYVLEQGHFEKRTRPHAKYHLEPVALKTTDVDPADNLQSFRFTGFL